MPKQADGKGASQSPEYEVLLQELRTLLPGVEVLFAFLLIVPFQGSFGDLTTVQRAVYTIAFVAAALSSMLLAAPSLYHRIRWREAHREEVLKRAQAIALFGTILLAVAVSATVYVVIDLVYGLVASLSIVAVVLLSTVWFWFAQPLLDRARMQGRRRR